jgi:hypothetical protein
MKHSTNVTLTDGSTTTWGSAAHIAALRVAWPYYTTRQQKMMRTYFPAVAQLSTSTTEE